MKGALKACIGLFSTMTLLAGCVDMPHPFGDPGPEGRRLALTTPPPRLAVPTPPDSLLDNTASALWAREVAAQLVDQSLPAVAQPAKPGDWWLKLSATLQGSDVTPHYVVMMPNGEARGHWDAAPVPASVWAQGEKPVLSSLAAASAPQVSAVLTGIQAAMMQADPHSLKRRPAKVYFKGVKGAPGDGNVSLARAFTASFPDRHDQLQSTPKDADYSVEAIVTVSNGPAGTTGHPSQHIEISWRTVAADGKEAGAATQLHDIDAHSLDGPWGDVAMAAASEAAGGVHQIITNYSGRDHKPLPPETPAAKK
ncbi:hypothetical protein [Asaia spathodeae]|uniref:Lipoprotein n=1 Tax=Asaia spathodeae TaxID=657016 RepID=A0ABX2P8H6_9PROT|nr:hypothetical protein [Asaia spathodeae]GBR12566.1 hypothetical protein AA105894_0560 [Asaia spathodeae NBRC 105894]